MTAATPCAAALAAIEADPLDLPEACERHLRQCPACAEARVAWLAQADSAQALAPIGYFEHLPERILGKLPPRPKARQPWFWAVAATLLLSTGVGGFMLGRRPEAPVTEARRQTPVAETYEILPDTPFQEGDEALGQLSNLSPDEVQVVLDRMEHPEAP